MTLEEAKEILSVYRDDLPLNELPEASEALAMLETNDALQRWLEEEQKFDKEITNAFRKIEVPEDLATKILTESPSKAAEAESVKSKIITLPTQRLWMAAAAAVVLTAAGLVKYFAFPPPVEFPVGEFTSVSKFRQDMAFYTTERFVLDHITKDFTEARDWLREHQSPPYDETPGAVMSFEGMGCQTFDWDKHKVSLVCFKNDDDDIVHLFVANKAAFKELMPASELQIMQVEYKLETGGWMTENEVFLFVGSNPDVKISALLASIKEI